MILAIASISAVVVLATSRGYSQIVGLNDGLNIAPSDIPKLEALAASGSADAAVRLSGYYLGFALNGERGRFWTEIGAENGDVRSMLSLANMLSEGADRFSKIRAKFWYEKVVASRVQPEAGYAQRSLQSPKR
jgi:TPR repeat protein